MRRHKGTTKCPKQKTTQAQKTPTTPTAATSTGALHPIWGTAPVMWRCTRYVALHPNRRGALPTDRVQCPNIQEQTRNWHTEPLTATPLHAHLGPTGGRTGTPPTPPPAPRPTPTPPTPQNAKSHITCWLCRDFSACWHGKTHIEGDCSSWGANAPTYLMRGRTSGRVWTLGFRGQFASPDGAHHARPLVRHRLLHRRRHRLRRRLRHRLRRRRQRMTPIGRAIEECRMQFPRHCVAPHIHIVGIATFVDTVEHSLNRIACETAPSER